MNSKPELAGKGLRMKKRKRARETFVEVLADGTLVPCKPPKKRKTVIRDRTGEFKPRGKGANDEASRAERPAPDSAQADEGLDDAGEHGLGHAAREVGQRVASYS